MCRTTTQNASSKGEAAEAPFLLRMWLALDRAVPHFKIGGLDFGFTIASCLFLYVVKLATVQVLVHIAGFPADDIAVAEKGASFLVPIVHSTNLVPGLFTCFMSHKYKPSARFDGTDIEIFQHHHFEFLLLTNVRCFV